MLPIAEEGRVGWVWEGGGGGIVMVGFCEVEEGLELLLGSGRMAGRPAREATICLLKICVPGPGAWVEDGARGRPG